MPERRKGIDVRPVGLRSARLAFSSGTGLAYDWPWTTRHADRVGIGTIPSAVGRGGPKADHDPTHPRPRDRVQVLYQLEQNPASTRTRSAGSSSAGCGATELGEFAEGLIAGVRANQPRIDALIAGVAENWRLERMAAIDRNILRLGAFEMLYGPDVPTKVAINEALELAKRYSTAQSSRFVNGILDRLQAAEPSAGKKRRKPPAEVAGPTDRPTEKPKPDR